MQVSSQTIFEKMLLLDVTNNIAVSCASFESRAEVYNRNFGCTDEERLSNLTPFARDQMSQWRLNEQRVEDDWFLWTLVNIYHQEDILSSTDFFSSPNRSNRKDIDTLAAEAWEHLCSKSNPWIHHSCSKKGCAEGTLSSTLNVRINNGLHCKWLPASPYFTHTFNTRLPASHTLHGSLHPTLFTAPWPPFFTMLPVPHIHGPLLLLHTVLCIICGYFCM